MDDVEKEKRSLLKDEYLHIQKTIVELDGRAITIKAWSVSFSLASAGAAFAVHRPPVLLLSAFSALMFWVIEARWKQFQYGFYGRSKAIELFFQGLAPGTIPMQIDHHWYSVARTSEQPRLLKVMRKSHVALPHVAIAAGAVLLFILARRGALTI
ncbi:hypothetical protein [Variovorax saccharolyticus]|uniref:hypothetical protein n=1 Tax=Variovorax saccharolyticus TaxID=3053516 RepID=UPI0025763154|nr:hypothetical protein [Variovorax sp. J31P216]MDM0029866.1 hypothetical protein [Variovorax sp. J31P216]